ncbi:ferric reductase-like transmembrane domain-containing protein [Agromyces aurantiacus]|uniref:Ferric reductase-like transmembrane domain-containing protein n=1 Tax=Agromyces aurantiacus TaxID=165814 RepID=A0ABV9R254_9MICO|nr:ferredoxin reductase family protein [Agromyces aurantiacus]MBM7505625.1 putative ferric reductase [Agromyces aurantiacus]
MAFLVHDARHLERPMRPFGGSQRPSAGRRLWRVDLLQALAVASVAVAVGLFLAEGGATRFGDPGSALTSLGIIAGLAATDLVLVMLLLAARVPLIERAVGHDAAMALHGRIGKPVLYLLIAHGVLLLAGYAIADGVDLVAEAVAIWSLPDLPLAILGFALFLAVVVTSLVAVRRKLRYEAWHLVHLLSYAAVLAALPHQFSVGGLFAEGTWQRVYWMTATVATLAAVVAFRLVAPIAATLRHGLVVESVTQVGDPADGVVSVTMRGRGLERLRATGGQFFIWRFLAPGQWWQAHPYSLSAAPRGDRLRITVRALGDGSTDLAGVLPGTRVAMEGPYGIFSEASRTRRRLTLVAAGIGVTPIRSLLESATFRPGEATVVLRTPAPADGWLLDEVQALCRTRGATLITVPGGRGRGWLTDAAERQGLDLATLVPAVADSDLYVCGPRGWSEGVIEQARAAGLASEQIHHERFDW